MESFMDSDEEEGRRRESIMDSKRKFRAPKGVPYADEEPAESDVESVRERLKRKSDNKNKRKQLLAASNEEVKEKGGERKQTQKAGGGREGQ